MADQSKKILMHEMVGVGSEMTADQYQDHIRTNRFMAYYEGERFVVHGYGGTEREAILDLERKAKAGIKWPD